MKKPGRKQVLISKSMAKEHVRTVHGMLSAECSITKELLEERARDKKRQAICLKRRITWHLTNIVLPLRSIKGHLEVEAVRKKKKAMA